MVVRPLSRCVLITLVGLFLQGPLLLTRGSSAYGLPAGERLRVGVALPLSGVLAEFGVPVRNAFELAKQKDPARFEGIDLIYEDYQSDPKNSFSVFNKLVEVDRVDAVYVWGATFGEAVAPLAQARKVPLMVLSLSTTVARDRPYILRTMGSAFDYVRLLTEEIKKRNFKRVTLLQVEWVCTEELARAFKARMGSDLTIQHLTIAKGELNLKPLFPKIVASKPDAILVFLGTGQISQFYRSMSELKLRVPTIGNDFYANPQEIRASGSAIEGAIFPLLKMCDALSSAYQQSFGNNDYLSHVANAYDVANLIADTAKRTSSRDNFLTELLTAGERRGICGSYKVVSKGEFGAHLDYPIELYSISGGKIVPLA
jgi:ABC-type branched-subunit amino acid transport system substrate-binding protein